MRDLIIGDGSHLRSWSATHYSKRDDLNDIHFAHNRELFSVTGKLFNESYIIMKNTPEGQRLQEMLDDQSINKEDIMNYIDELFIKNVSFEVLLRHIKRMRENSFRSGQINIKMQLKQLITI